MIGLCATESFASGIFWSTTMGHKNIKQRLAESVELGLNLSDGLIYVENLKNNKVTIYQEDNITITSILKSEYAGCTNPEADNFNPNANQSAADFLNESNNS